MRPRFLHFLRSRKFWQRSAFAVACLATLIAAFYAIEDARGHAAWVSYREAAKARGVKLDWRDFIPPPIPDEENFAAIPIMQERMSSEPAPRVGAAARLPLPNTQNGGFANAREGERMDFAIWQECFLQNGFLADRTSDPVADVLRALERYEPTLAQLRGALSRPRSQLVSDWEKGYEADFWRLGDHLTIGQILSLRVAALLASGRNEEAFLDWRAQLRHSDIFQTTPTLLACTLRLMLLTIAVNTAWQGIAAEQWSDAQLTEIEAVLRPIDLVAAFAWAMQSERALLNFALDRVKRDPGYLHEFIQGGRKKGWSWELLLPTGWIDQNQLRINQWFDATILEAKQPISGAALPKTSPQRRGWRPYWFIVDSATYGFGEQRELYGLRQNEVDLCRVSCALKRFQLRTGMYPQSLDELVPALLPAVPPDRYDGQPLRYRRTDDGLVLYSGPNRRDDGGDDPDHSKDITWRVPPSARAR